MLLCGLNSESHLSKTEQLFLQIDQINLSEVDILWFILDSHSLSTCFTKSGTKIERRSRRPKKPGGVKEKRFVSFSFIKTQMTEALARFGIFMRMETLVL